MKKIIALLMVLVVAVAVFVACDNGEATSTEKDYTLAIGVVATPNTTSGKVDETVAVIVTDADGKIVLCRLDCVTYQVKYDDAGALVTTAPLSKYAQGDSYDSYSPMPAGRWYQQSGALENYVVGKTQAEVAAVVSNGYAADADLKASCSIAISDLCKAIDNAFKSAHKVTFKSTATEFTAAVSIAGAVKDSSTDESKNAKYSADFAGAVLVDGKVVAAIIDSSEIEFKNITDEGAEVSYAGTKREQGDNYDAYSPMPAGRWYQQVDAFANTAVGKTASDIAGLATEGVAGCTIYSGGYKAAVEAAVKGAR